MKLHGSVILVMSVVAVTIVATVYRVSTAPERIRMRLDAAKAACINAGNEWVTAGREMSCQPVADRKKI